MASEATDPAADVFLVLNLVANKCQQITFLECSNSAVWSWGSNKLVAKFEEEKFSGKKGPGEELLGPELF